MILRYALLNLLGTIRVKREKKACKIKRMHRQDPAPSFPWYNLTDSFAN